MLVQFMEVRVKIFSINSEKDLNNPLNLSLRNVRQPIEVTGGGRKARTKMQLPSIERNPNQRPVGADVVSSGANRVIPVAPVNPSVAVTTAAVEPTPSVINMVKPPAPAADPNDPVYTHRADPMVRNSEAATAPKDWTIHRPEKEPQKEETPPPPPLSQVLMDHLRTVWTASASAVQIEQVSNTLTDPRQTVPLNQPGQLAKQSTEFKPSEITKTEKL